MAAAALLSVTLVPALMVLFVRGKDHSGAQKSDQSFSLLSIYRPVIKRRDAREDSGDRDRGRHSCSTVWPARQLGTEFMPNLNEGTLPLMPTTLPGLSVTKAAELLQTQDRIIRSFPSGPQSTARAGRARDGGPIRRRPRCSKPSST
jgi:Cu(I)/Ag(I) efflux system membrane protein CusA/SilA